MLEFKNVSYVYGKKTPFEKAAVNDISLTIKDNAVTGLIGHTGSGKSTLALMMNALLSPTSGKVLLDGQDINAKGYNTTSVRYDVGLVFQYPEYQLFEETVYKDIAYGPKNMGLSDEDIDERVHYAAHFTGIDKALFEKSPFELSGGQKRRVAIAGVIAMDPKILVLDEPAAGLDPKGRSEILSGLCDFRKKRGNSLVIISHSMEDIAIYSDEIIAMSQGRILTSGTPEQVFSQSQLLKENGLDIPQVTEVLYNLSQKGINVQNNKYTLEEAYKTIRELF
jgi:energy-coupling factor transport system ATP-binding protein